MTPDSLVPDPVMFNAAKDKISSRAAQTWINKHIGRYGKVEHLQIDSRKKTVEISCVLDGEPAPVTIRVKNYVIESEDGRKFIRATDFQCTRPWLQNLLMDYGTRRRFEMPGWCAAAL
jgi:hypothetical protein